MNKYIENVNTYLSQMKIKQTFISLKTGMDPSKLSRILKGNQDVTSADMELIASALGKKPEDFFQENFQSDFGPGANIKAFENAIAFYAGKPGAEQEKFALRLLELIENADEVLGARSRLVMAIEE